MFTVLPVYFVSRCARKCWQIIFPPKTITSPSGKKLRIVGQLTQKKIEKMFAITLKFTLLLLYVQFCPAACAAGLTIATSAALQCVAALSLHVADPVEKKTTMSAGRWLGGTQEVGRAGIRLPV